MFTKLDPKLESLRSVSLFAGCTEAELARVGALVDEVEVAAGCSLICEGTSGHECFIVADGTASATLRGEHVATFGAGSIFGEMALLDHEPRAATIVAETPMRLYVLDRRRFASLLSNNSSVAAKVLKVLVERLRHTERAPVWS